MNDTNINYDELAEAILKNELLVGKISGRIAQAIYKQYEDLKPILGKLKNEVQLELSELSKRHVAELRDDMNKWFNGHMKEHIINRRESIVSKLEEQLDSFFQRDPMGSLRATTESIIIDLIRKKFSKQKFSFTIEDLILGNREDDPDF